MSNTSAEQDIKAAVAYLDEVEQQFLKRKRAFTFDDTTVLFSILDNAAKQLASARKKNSLQKLKLKDGNGTQVSLDDIAAAISSREGYVALVASETAFDADNRLLALARARDAFEKATKFDPDNVGHYVNLAEVHKLLGNKDYAAGTIATALKLDPDDADALKLNDEISEMQETQITQNEPMNPLLKYGLIGVVLIVAGWNAVGRLPDIIAALLQISGWILTGGSIYLSFAMRKEYNQYKDRRQSEELAEMIAEGHERRYQAERERKRR